jgi:hypothetical protein
MLKERVQLLSDRSKYNQCNLDWIVNNIDENRIVNDMGMGGTRWLDVFVNYVPNTGRGDDCTTMTMRECLIHLGSIPESDPVKSSF